MNPGGFIFHSTSHAHRDSITHNNELPLLGLMQISLEADVSCHLAEVPAVGLLQAEL